jgi:hypothetical protein
MATSTGDVLIDIKIYRSNTIDPNIVGNAIRHLQQIAKREGVGHVKLVTNVDLPFVDRVGALDGVLYEIIGPIQLYGMKAENEVLAELYEATTSIIQSAWDVDPRSFAPRDVAPPNPVSLQRGGFDGKAALQALKDCPAGDGALFERVCIDAIKGVFANDFNRWSEPQHRIEDGHHRLDLLGHINSRNDFWTGIRYDFRSRYVVFEFKNYNGLISQKEIYSTEKYLFAGALRMVAIMVARNGEDDGSKKARIGAVREHGKLIMLLTHEDLKKIVDDFNKGEDPYAVLIDNLHGMLSTIGR